MENYAQNKKKVRAYMYKLITFKKKKHLKQISYNEFSKSHEAFMWIFDIFQGFCRCTFKQCKHTTKVIFFY